MLKKNSPLISLLAIVLSLFPVLSQAQEGISKSEVLQGKLIHVIDDLKSIPVTFKKGGFTPVQKPKKKLPLFHAPSPLKEDPALQKNSLSNNRLEEIVNWNFPGIHEEVTDPADEYGVSVPDPTLAVSPLYIVQMVNGFRGSLFQIWNKANGQILQVKSPLDLITNKGGWCDPIVLYDHIADRFFMSEMVLPSEFGGVEGIVIAVSQTNDPRGGWNTYHFAFPGESIDYPKFSVWTDAYYGTLNHSTTGGAWASSALYAFNKTQMLAGNATADVQRVFLPEGLKARSACPVLWQGNTPPPTGTGGLFAVMQDDSWTSSTTDKDSIGIYEFKVNFSNPSLKQVRQIASLATLNPFKSEVCPDADQVCIDAMNNEGVFQLKATSGRVMNQPIYRNFGTYQGIVMTHVVDKSASIAGVRWYELRKTTGNWSIHQESTYGPGTDLHRWLPTIAYDGHGNIGLAYNTSSSTSFTSIRFTGRKVCDPLNTMTYPERIIVASDKGHYHEGRRSSYGDYNHMVADPNGNSLWFTAEYDRENFGNWSTQITNISLDVCACAAPTTSSTTNLSNTSATLNWAAINGANSYTVEYKASTSTTWIVATTSTTATNFNLSGLSSGVTYDWRVKSNCFSSPSTYTQAQFTTTSSSCSNTYEPNDTRNTAVAFTPNTTISSIINTGADNDWYKFSNNSTLKNIRVRLTNLPADYDVEMYRSGSTSVVKYSRNNGLANEGFYLNTSTYAQYEVRVYPKNSTSFNATSCYNLQIELSNSSFSSAREDNDEATASIDELAENKGVYAYPVPADEKLNINYFVPAAGNTTISLLTPSGVVLKQIQVTSNSGKNAAEMKVKEIPTGIYLLKVEQDNTKHTSKVVLSH